MLIMLVLIPVSQGDVELPEVPSEPLPEAPEAAEKKAGLFVGRICQFYV